MASHEQNRMNTAATTEFTPTIDGRLQPTRMGMVPPAEVAADPAAPVSYTHLTLPTIYSV